MKVSARFHNLCGPAKAYLVISILLYILHIVNINNRMDADALIYYIVHFIVVLLWTLFLNWICSMKHGVAASWVMFFSPLILLITMMIAGSLMIDKMGLTKEDIQTFIQQSEKDCDCDKD
jgi:hypothetical protein